jgi:Domain of unknown function (DUF4388)
MSMTGSLETFSLPELFRLIDSGAKTGQLIIQPPLNHPALDLNHNYQPSTYHLWFHKGRLITTVNHGLNHECLVSLIKNSGWLSSRVIEKLAEICPAEVPLGNYLSKMKVLETEKLKLLFQLQLHQVYQLFNLNSGQFQLEVYSPEKLTSASMPWMDMTGISMQASQVNLLALRIMRNWSSFAHKLPEKNSALQQLIHQPKFPLTALEQEVWQMALSNISLEQLAQSKNISLLEIRKAAFCLMMARLVEEIPLANFQPIIRPDSARGVATLALTDTRLSKSAIAVQNNPEINSPEISPSAKSAILPPEQPIVSQTLLNKLVNFLRSKL